ncbi:MAG: 16S rRNA (guanine(966)-N(2))-methyltransferase RsmD [Bacillota bacterium]
MRVIAGTLKRRIIKEVPHKGTRSTRDRVKENLFNMLPPLSGTHVLDLFAGSGALGFEALSRGAAAATFCEMDSVAFKVLTDNASDLGLEDRSALEKGDALSMLKRFDTPYDVIMLDPPYNKDLANKSLEIIEDKGLLSSGGLIAILHETGETLHIPDAFQITKTRTYGITSLTFLEWSD